MSKKKEIKINTESDEVEDSKDARDDVNAEGEKTPPSEDVQSDDNLEPHDPVKELEAKLKCKEQEAQENYDRLLRVSAEFENYKKRNAREMEEFRKFANQSLIKEMLSVVDNLELAINSSDGSKNVEKSVVEGLSMTLKELLKVFEKFDVKPIEATGKPFDPAFHEAIMGEETDDYPENTVVNEFQKGYMIHDRLLRPAMVVVAKPRTKKEEPGDT